MSGNNYTFKQAQTNSLVGIAYYEEAIDFVQVDAPRAVLDLRLMRELHPKIFQVVKKDIERGYRTTDDELIIRIENTFLDYLYSSWRMSYIGKGVIHLRLSNYTRLSEARNALKGLIELMENPCTLGWHGDHIRLAAPITYRQVWDSKRKKERSVPQIIHSFREIRPLILKELEGERELRKEALDVWNKEHTLRLDWRKS